MITDGIEKLKWYQQENGLYTIQKVPIFKTFKDEKNEVSERDAKKIIENFENGKKTGFFPRVHIGHHSMGYENQPGVGFLDNLIFQNGVFYSDIAEVNSETMSELKAKKYPNRSVEYHQDKQTIMSLALLESRAPYHQFPIMVLEEDASVISNFQLEIEKLRHFSMKGIKMADEEKKETSVEEEKKPETEEKMQEKSEPSGMEADIRLIKEMVQKIYEMELSEHAGESAQTGIDVPEKPRESVNKMPTVEEQGKRPGSVAFQSEIDFLKKEIETLKNKDIEDLSTATLRNMCDIDSKLDFNAHSKILKKFQTNADKQEYLNLLKLTNPGFDHPAKQMALKFQDKQNPLSKYQSETPEMQRIAREAYQNWMDTASQPNADNARKFQMLYPDPGKFIEHVVEGEKIEPGYHKRFSY